MRWSESDGVPGDQDRELERRWRCSYTNPAQGEADVSHEALLTRARSAAEDAVGARRVFHNPSYLERELVDWSGTS